MDKIGLECDTMNSSASRCTNLVAIMHVCVGMSMFTYIHTHTHTHIYIYIYIYIYIGCNSASTNVSSLCFLPTSIHLLD